MMTYMRLLPFGVVKAVLPPNDPYWAVDGNTSLFNIAAAPYADVIRTVQLNSTTFAWVAFPDPDTPDKISVRVPVFLGESNPFVRQLLAVLPAGITCKPVRLSQGSTQPLCRHASYIITPDATCIAVWGRIAYACQNHSNTFQIHSNTFNACKIKSMQHQINLGISTTPWWNSKYTAPQESTSKLASLVSSQYVQCWCQAVCEHNKSCLQLVCCAHMLG